LRLPRKLRLLRRILRLRRLVGIGGLLHGLSWNPGLSGRLSWKLPRKFGLSGLWRLIRI
jgi:hypothetical protein